MTDALKMVYKGRFKERKGTGKYDHVLPFIAMDEKVFDKVDKVAVAKAVTELPVNLDVLDLRENIQKIVQMIHVANSH